MIFNYLMWRCETFSGTTSTTKVRTYWNKLANTFHIFDQKRNSSGLRVKNLFNTFHEKMASAASCPCEKVSRDEKGADSSVLVLAKQISHGTLARFFLLSSTSENIKSRIEP